MSPSTPSTITLSSGRTPVAGYSIQSPPPVEDIFVDVEQLQPAEHAASGKEADAIGCEVMQASVHMANAAVHAIDVGARVRQTRVDALTDLQCFATVMESQFVGMFTRAVADDTGCLGKGGHEILHVRRGSGA
ncbi:MAG TPA: hypothetical protein EYQ50_15585 [Verrucomicrobiales bacterium]|nr:hypothetical protein [Verrucomicrobiales bacterium]